MVTLTVRTGFSIFLLGAGLMVFAAAGRAAEHAHEAHARPREQTPAPQPPAVENRHDHGGHAGHVSGQSAIAAFRKTVPEDYRIMERTPVIDSQESLLRGRKLFMLHCTSCHGALGRGDGSSAAGLKPAPADFLDFAHSAQYGPGLKYWLIAKGSGALGMPGQPKLPPRDVWHLVNYILTMQAKVRSEGYDMAPHKH